MKLLLIMLILAVILTMTGCAGLSFRDQGVMDNYNTYLNEQVHDGKMTQAEADYHRADKASELRGRHHNHMHTFFKMGPNVMES